MKLDCKVRVGCVSPREVCISTVDSDIVNKRLDIDPFGTAKALLNPCGFPMNDIMAFESAQP